MWNWQQPLDLAWCLLLECFCIKIQFIYYTVYAWLSYLHLHIYVHSLGHSYIFRIVYIQHILQFACPFTWMIYNSLEGIFTTIIGFVTWPLITNHWNTTISYNIVHTGVLPFKGNMHMHDMKHDYSCRYGWLQPLMVPLLKQN